MADDYIPHDDPRRQANFENWFGYSHVTDENGKPFTLYHGTDADVAEFDPSKIGQTDHGWYGEGHYLTASPELAVGYSGYKNTKAMSGEEIHPGQNVMPVHVRLENPYYWPESRPAATSKEEAKKITEELRRLGHDGVIAPNRYADGPEAKFWEVVVFTPHQIKSAIGNNGQYSMKSARLDKAEGGSVDDDPPPPPRYASKQDWPSHQFVEKMYAENAPFPYSRNRQFAFGYDPDENGQVQGYATAQLTPHAPRDARIAWLEAGPQRKGYGSKALDTIKKAATDHNIRLTLMPWDKGQVPKSALVRFYKRNGFKLEPGGRMVFDPAISKKAEGGSVDDRSIGWSTDRIERELNWSHYDDGRAKAHVGFVNPHDFLHATTKTPASAKDIESAAGDLDEDQLSQSSQSPFLKVRDGKIVDHEGRHRMAALAAAGHKRVPVMVWHDQANKLAPIDRINLNAQHEGRPGLSVFDAVPLHRSYKSQIENIMGGANKRFAGGGSVDENEDKGITAYHGSPYDFPKFDISKIDTGEGAQAYGHGLYFAESEPVAKGYRDRLRQEYAFVDGEKIPHPSEENPESDVVYKLANQLYQMGWNTDQAVDFANKHAESLKEDLNSENFYKKGKAEHAQRWAESIAPFKGKKVEWKTDPGHMYEVRINAHPDQFLDWDAPLRDQPEPIRRLAGWDSESESSYRSWWNKDNQDLLEALEGTGSYTSTKPPPRPAGSLPMSMKGSDLYEHLQNKMGATDWPTDADSDTRSQFRKSSAQRVSEYLSDNGIRGIKYLDAGSRGAGEGSRNYVVFNHDHVDIKRKYARGGAVDAG